MDPDVFISYAWVNSASAIKAKQATEKVGSLGHGDPREIKNFLEKNGISCWLDVERVGRVRIFLFPRKSLSLKYHRINLYTVIVGQSVPSNFDPVLTCILLETLLPPANEVAGI